MMLPLLLPRSLTDQLRIPSLMAVRLLCRPTELCWRLQRERQGIQVGRALLLAQEAALQLALENLLEQERAFPLEPVRQTEPALEGLRVPDLARVNLPELAQMQAQEVPLAPVQVYPREQLNLLALELLLDLELLQEPVERP